MTPHPRTRFRTKGLYRHKQPHAFHFVSKRYSFWVATLSVFTFVVGNMVGQHGWFAFWHSVMGKVDDASIVFTGTVPPIDRVPDYALWAQYGGDPEVHTFRMVPEQALVPLPVYAASHAGHDLHEKGLPSSYSIGNLGSYRTGVENSGSHVGVDIRVPVGTPVLAIANGIVETVRDVNGGFGRYVTIRHPNVPDASRTGGTTTVHSTYAHLDTMLVTEGSVVTKGQQIATSGKTGFATGPHLHFQIDNEDAPYHPYWPFTSTEASSAGMTFTEAINAGLGRERGALYTLNPMLFVQSHFSSSTTVVRDGMTATDVLASNPLRALSSEERLEARRNERLARLERTAPAPLLANAESRAESSVLSTVVETVAQAVTQQPRAESPQKESVSSVSIEHDGRYHRGWETIYIHALNAEGDVVRDADFSGVLYLRETFGTAEFRPDRLTASSFENGVATVYVLPSGSKRAFIMEANGAFHAVSAVMEYQK